MILCGLNETWGRGYVQPQGLWGSLVLGGSVERFLRDTGRKREKHRALWEIVRVPQLPDGHKTFYKSVCVCVFVFVREQQGACITEINAIMFLCIHTHMCVSDVLDEKISRVMM